MYRALISAMNHPDPLNPYMGLFNYRSFRALSGTGVHTDTVSARPIAPPFGPYSEYRTIPDTYRYRDYKVDYPRFAYLIPQRLFRYNLSSRSFRRMLPTFVEERFERPDVCHAGHIHYDGYGLVPYCREHDLPLTVMGRGKLLNNYYDLPRSGRVKIRETLEYADRILCVSGSLAEIAEDIVDEPKATVLPNGADPDRYPTDQRAAIRRELGIDPDSRLILFCGGFTKRKGIYEIAEALPDVDRDDVLFVFVGHYGDLRDELLTALEGSGHNSYEVRWEVPPMALRRWFAIADIFMLPSHAEGRPNTVYEAMASETAVVASAVSGIPEQVVDGETGILIPPRDPDRLSAALNELLRDPDRRREMGESGRRRLVDNDWTWAAHGERLADIHRELIG